MVLKECRRQSSHSPYTRWITFFISCLSTFTVGSAYSIAAYTEDFKTLFNLSQREYGIFATVYMLGTQARLLSGLLLDKVGPPMVHVISLVLTVCTHTILWQMPNYPDFVGVEYVLYTSALLGGLGFSGMYISAMSVNMTNFSHSAHGSVSATIAGINWIGTLFFTLLYREVFSPDISGYFLMITLMSGVINFAAIFLVYKTDMTAPTYEPIEFMDIQEDAGNIVDSFEDTGLLNNQSKRKQQEIMPWTTSEFHLLFWIFMFSAPVSHGLIVTFSTFTDSLGFENDTTWMISMMPVLGAVTLFVGGPISDHCLKSTSRMVMAAIINFVTSVSLVLSIFLIDKLYVLIFLVLITAVTFVSIDSIIPSELYKQFGEKHYGTVLGGFFFSQAILNIPLQYIASLFYDLELKSQQKGGGAGSKCIGKSCFMHGFILFSVLYILCFTLNVIYIYYKKRQDNRNTL